MPKTRFQSIIFAALMVVFMVFAMEVYNQGLLGGSLTWTSFRSAVLEMRVMVPICFIMSFFIADPIASRLSEKVTGSQTERIIRIVVRAAITVSMMCPIMSFWGTLLFQSPSFALFIPAWLTTAAKNMPMALIWQILFCGPLVRFLFSRIFPEKD